MGERTEGLDPKDFISDPEFARIKKELTEKGKKSLGELHAAAYPAQDDSLYNFVVESNKIEGITRDPTPAEIEVHRLFLEKDVITLKDLEAFVRVVSPYAQLRGAKGLDVRIGNHYPPKGGPAIVDGLLVLLNKLNAEKITPYHAHVMYEKLHPFTDGNGRSGRALWLWSMGKHWPRRIGFLHAFYYQTLENSPAWVQPEV